MALAAVLASTPSTIREATASELKSALSPSERGRPKVVHLWASWCRPCVAEMPRLLRELRRRGDLLDAVLVSLDDAGAAKAAANLLDRWGGAPGESLRASASDLAPVIRTLYGAWDGSLPATYLVSGDGTLLVSQQGITDFDLLLSETDRATSTMKRTIDRRTKT
ncbi:MAG TPA: hypothetical protein VMK12_00285 [Anaeromyxobacteraceae bacterium]|nr:hypothetical protein [Anaeromyxobacteraceae bacterium]